MANQESKKSNHLPKENADTTEGKAPGKAKPSAAEEAREQREIRREARQVEGEVRDTEINEEDARESVYGRAAVEQERRAALDERLKGTEKTRGLGEGEGDAVGSVPPPSEQPGTTPPIGTTTGVGTGAEPAPATPAPAAPEPRTYTVVSGDTLSHIAKNFYGDASQWRKIYEANRDKISNPDLIHPGQVFLIP